MMAKKELDSFFRPEGCVVWGASTDTRKAGRQIVENMLASGFSAEKLFLVNDRETGSLSGLDFFPALSDVPGEAELVIWARAAGRVDDGIADLERRMAARGDVRAMIVVAAGFAETGEPEGVARQERLLACCRHHGIRVIGPNCVGVIDNQNRLDTSFILGTGRQAGGISIISQSGAIGSWLMMDWASNDPPVPFNKVISLGNMADVDTEECLAHLGIDPETSVIGMYMEGYPRARALMELARRVSAEKPVLTLKVGRSEAGRRAAQSHTGSLAGADRIYDAAFRQYGILRVDTIEELSDSLRAFDVLPPPKGNRVFVVTQAGGPGIYCADALGGSREFAFAEISDTAKAALKEILPRFASVCHPEGHADITAAADAKQHGAAVEAILAEETVDALILITVPTLFVPAQEIAAELVAAMARLRGRGIVKPFLPVLLSGNSVREARAEMERSGLLTFETPDRAARALRQLICYSAYRREGTLC